MWDVIRPNFSLDFSQKKLYNNYNKKRKEQKNVKGINFNFYYSKCSKCHNPNNKSLATIKCGKVGASIVNAIAFGLYTVVVVYTVCELPLWFKVIVVAVANFVGVFFVKWLEEKFRKEKLWKVELTIPRGVSPEVFSEYFNTNSIPFNYIDIDKYVIFNCFCATGEDTEKVIEIAEKYGGKYFVSESKK